MITTTILYFYPLTTRLAIICFKAHCIFHDLGFLSLPFLFLGNPHLVSIVIILVMGCFSCLLLNHRFQVVKQINNTSLDPHPPEHGEETAVNKKAENKEIEKRIPAEHFSFRELTAIAGNFSPSRIIGEGGFGKVYRGFLQSGQSVAIKCLNHEGQQGHGEFLIEVLMLSHLRHINLVKLIGYCNEGDQRLLVYEFMPKGSLDVHLFNTGPKREPLDWNTRMRIAVGVARGLRYLHCEAKPPVIYRDMKASNILLDNDFFPKLSDFGLAKVGPVGNSSHVSTRVMGTHGYCEPEYLGTGQLTLKSDIYGFGVVLLELITGRMALDYTKPQNEHYIVVWARPFLKEKKKMLELADPVLKGCFPESYLTRALVIARSCIIEQRCNRPDIRDVVEALEHVANQSDKWKTAQFVEGLVMSVK